MPEDATILTADEATAVADRAFQVRAGCEDVLTALREGASHSELEQMCVDLVERAAEAERLR